MSELMIERMNITRYYARVDKDYWTASNKAEAQVKKLAREMERRLIPARQVDEFIARFIVGVDKINKANPRCKPLHVNYGRSLDPSCHDLSVYVDGITHFELSWVKD